MPKIVDKEKRKEAIMKVALEVFAREGYKDANLTLISEQSGISRPTIYQYFQDKNDIFYFAVKRVTDRMFSEYSKIAWDEESKDTEIERILHICSSVFEYAKENEATVVNLFEFMIAEKKQGVDFSAAINKRTQRLQILLKRLIRQGIDKETIKRTDIEKLSNGIYNLVESCCIQIAFFENFSKEDANHMLKSYIYSFKNN